MNGIDIEQIEEDISGYEPEPAVNIPPIEEVLGEDGLTEAVTWVDQVGYFFESIGDAISNVATVIADDIGYAIANMNVYIQDFAVWVWENVEPYISPIIDFVQGVYNYIEPYVDSVVGYVKTFLSWIQFNTLMNLHNAGMLLSPAYRKVVSKLYGGIYDLSRNLGLDASFMLMAIRDVRNLFWNVSAGLGNGYDVAQIQWLGQLTDFLKTLEDKTDVLQKDPGKILEFIEDTLEIDIMNAMSEQRIANFSIIGGLTDTLRVLGDGFTSFKDNIEKIVLDLPSGISKEIMGKIQPKFDKFDTFITKDFNRVLDSIDGVSRLLAGVRKSHDDKLGELTRAILNPGDSMEKIDLLPDKDRIRQEDKIYEISTRTARRTTQSVNASIEEKQSLIDKLFDEKTARKPEPEILKYEYEGIQYKPLTPPEPFATWFVGDY